MNDMFKFGALWDLNNR